MLDYSLPKVERVSLRREVERIFSSESSSVMAYPIRAVYLTKERTMDQPSVKMMVTVPKKCLRHAVDRNRVKRQLREAYRHMKHPLMDLVDTLKDKTLLIAFVWTDKKIYPSIEVEKRMEKLLCRISENVAKSSVEA